MSHPNFGVSSFSDEHDALLHDTVAKLKRTPVPHEDDEKHEEGWHPDKNLSYYKHTEGYVNE